MTGPLGRRAGAILVAVTVASFSSPAIARDADLTSAFGNFAGCALLLTRDRYGEDRLEFRPGECRIPRSPCSTFKIPNALIGLETGAVNGPGDLKRWDGIEREREVTNHDHTLASAMENSVVWYFQELARNIGPDSMQSWLDRLEYGNRDISAGIDRFWLGSSLKISGYEQLEFIRKLWRDGLPFRVTVQSQVRDMLLQDSGLPGTLYGKTGSCRGDPDAGTDDHGWFVGWIDWDKRNAAGPATSWFVVNISGEDAWGWQARNIALSVLEQVQP